MSEKEIELVHGSANVFRDFGEPHADLKRAKAVLAARIISVLDDRGLDVRKAASLTGFAAADFSRVRNADLGRFTLDWLMKMLAALDSNARVTVKVDLSWSAPAPRPAVTDQRADQVWGSGVPRRLLKPLRLDKPPVQLTGRSSPIQDRLADPNFAGSTRCPCPRPQAPSRHSKLIQVYCEAGRA